jgi:hypothetical protein
MCRTKSIPNATHSTSQNQQNAAGKRAKVHVRLLTWFKNGTNSRWGNPQFLTWDRLKSEVSDLRSLKYLQVHGLWCDLVGKSPLSGKLQKWVLSRTKPHWHALISNCATKQAALLRWASVIQELPCAFPWKSFIPMCYFHPGCSGSQSNFMFSGYCVFLQSLINHLRQHFWKLSGRKKYCCTTKVTNCFNLRGNEGLPWTQNFQS